MGKLKKILTNFRVMLLIAAFILSIVAIHPDPWAEGVAIRSVSSESAASLAGIKNPEATATPMARERIEYINGQKIKNLEDYNYAVSLLSPNRTITIRTNKNDYLLETRQGYLIEVLGELEEQTVTEPVLVNRTINGTIVEVEELTEQTVWANKTIKHPNGVEDLGLRVYDAPKTNIRKGLDLQGGTRVLLEPAEKVDEDTMGMTLDNLKERLNVYGISDLVVRQANDLSGNQYILAEIAGMNEDEVRSLLSQQGKFEAKIGNYTVFKGGEKDVTYVCRSADCSGIDPTQGCGQISEGGYACTFRFSIALRPEAAERQAFATKDLEIIRSDSGDEYLSRDLELYLDDAKVDVLKIGADLKGRAVTDIQISGSGVGTTQGEAMTNSLENMKRLQTIIITGSLPVQLEVVKVDVISPVLGSEFLRESMMIGLLALVGILVVISLKYKTPKVVVPMMIIVIMETVLVFGVASIIGWDMDLASIAGILVAVGTGIDDQIIIADETTKQKSSSQAYDLKSKVKNAFFIIVGAYLTVVVAMLPLLSAGAGLLKGFALTTIIGVTMGVLISRPAYGKIVEILLED